MKLFAKHILFLTLNVVSLFQQPTTAQSFDVSSSEPASFLVFMDPESLIGEGLYRSWRLLNENVDGRMIQGRPLSKINFRLQPEPNPSSATMNLMISGSSTGVSTSSTKNVRIESDALTQFKSQQWLILDASGLSFTTPQLKVASNQTLKKVDSNDRPFKAIFTRAAFKHFPEDVKRKADVIAEKLVRRQLVTTIGATVNQFNQAWNDLQQFDFLQGIALKFCTGSEFIYGFGYAEETGTIPRLKRTAFGMALHQSLIESEINRRLSSRTIPGHEFKSFLERNGIGSKSTALTRKKSTQPWSITLGESPTKIRFEKNCVNFSAEIENLKSGARTLENLHFEIEYKIQPVDDTIKFVKQGKLKLTSIESTGRDQIIVSVARSRFDKVLPENFKLPLSRGFDRLNQLGVDLELVDLQAKQNFLLIGMD